VRSDAAVCHCLLAHAGLAQSLRLTWASKQWYVAIPATPP
jgi:hypothetical protein